ncbi:hypothetical protein TNCV_1156121 [Trichonephila clavipes]|nr:hypothetical protein TNCV_1156121 [Trichonephila clavipes]
MDLGSNLEKVGSIFFGKRSRTFACNGFPSRMESSARFLLYTTGIIICNKCLYSSACNIETEGSFRRRSCGSGNLISSTVERRLSELIGTGHRSDTRLLG